MFKLVQTCTSLYRDSFPPDMFKFVHYWSTECRQAGGWHSTEMPSCWIWIRHLHSFWMVTRLNKTVIHIQFYSPVRASNLTAHWEVYFGYGEWFLTQVSHFIPDSLMILTLKHFDNANAPQKILFWHSKYFERHSLFVFLSINLVVCQNIFWKRCLPLGRTQTNQ